MKLLLGFFGVLFFTRVEAQPALDSIKQLPRYYVRGHDVIPDTIDKKWIIDNIPEPLEPLGKYIEYPETARRSNLEGKVILSALIDEDGLVRKVKVESSTNQIFNEPGRDALFRVRFKPALQDGKPIKIWYTVPISYKMPSD